MLEFLAMAEHLIGGVRRVCCPGTETLPAPLASWPRLTGWMPKRWLGSVRRFNQKHGR
jgi:hypothetical protein